MGPGHERKLTMRQKHSIRLLPVLALLGTASLAGAGASVPAGAAGGTVTCATVFGNPYSPPELFSCSQSQANDGGGLIEPFPFFSGPTQTGTIYWAGPSMTQAPTTVIRVRTKVLKKSGCATGTTGLKVSGSVRSDTSGVVKVGGPVIAFLCRTAGGSFTLLPGTSIVIG
jgi:hypothetical protein